MGVGLLLFKFFYFCSARIKICSANIISEIKTQDSKTKPDVMETPNRGLLIRTLSSGAFNVNRNIWNHIRFGDFKISCLLFINMHQKRPRGTFTVQQPDVRGDAKATAQCWIEFTSVVISAFSETVTPPPLLRSFFGDEAMELYRFKNASLR